MSSKAIASPVSDSGFPSPVISRRGSQELLRPLKSNAIHLSASGHDLSARCDSLPVWVGPMQSLSRHSDGLALEMSPSPSEGIRRQPSTSAKAPSNWPRPGI